MSYGGSIKAQKSDLADVPTPASTDFEELFLDRSSGLWGVKRAGGGFSTLINLAYYAGTIADVGTTASAGASGLVARGDHVHPLPFATVQTVLGAATGAIGVNSQKVTALANGTVATDAVNLGQLTAAVEGRRNKDPALWSTTGAVTLSGLATQGNGEWSGSLTAGDRVLVKNQASSATNGVYAAAAGAWARVADVDTGAEVTNASVLVLFGATLAGDTYTQTATVTTLGTDPQTWVQTGEGAVLTADGTTLEQVGTTIREKDGGTSNAKLANMTGPSVKGIVSGTGAPVDLTDVQLTAIVKPATGALAGTMSASDFTKLAGVAAGATAYTDESAQDAVAAMLTASNSIKLTYNDAGNIETVEHALTPITFSGASKTYVNSDRGAYYQRSNSGSAMTDTIPTLNGTTDVGWYMDFNNLGTTVAETITFSYAGGGTPFPGNSATYVLQYGCRQGLVWDGTKFIFWAGTGNSLRRGAPPVTAGAIVTFADTAGNLVAGVAVDGATLEVSGAVLREKDGGTTNAKLANMASATFKGQTSGGSGAPQDLTPAQAKTALAISTSDVSGLATIATSGSASDLSTGTVPAARMPALTGDVTTTLGTVATTIASRAVSYAKLQAVSVTARILGRITAGAGDVEELTGTQATSLLDLAGGVAGTIATALTSPGTFLKGLMSAADRKRTAGYIDAFADFGIVGDLVTTNGTTTVTGTAMTDSTNPFSLADVGKRVTVPYAGAGTGVNALQLTTTISAFVSANQVTLALGATNNKTNVSVNYGTDNTSAWAALVSAVNAMTYPAPLVWFGSGYGITGWTNAFGIPAPMIFNKAVAFEGALRSHTCDIGDYTKAAGTRLVWWGTSSDGGVDFGAAITVTAVAGASNQAVKAPSFRNLMFDGRNNDQNQALYGLRLVSCHAPTLENLFFMDCLAAGLITNVIPDSPGLGEASDTTRFYWSNLCFRQLDNTPSAMTTPVATTSAVTLSTTPQSLTVAANTLPTAGYGLIQSTTGRVYVFKYTSGGGTVTLGGCTVSSPESTVHTPATFSGALVAQATPGSGAAMILDGSANHNTCCGTIVGAQVSYGTTWGLAGFELGNSDSVKFIGIRMNGGSNTTTGGRAQRPGWRLNGSAVSAGLACRNITIEGCDPGGAPGGFQGGVSNMGLTNAGANLTGLAGPNYVVMQEMGNGAPVPTIEGNSLMIWTGNGCFLPGPPFARPFITTTQSLTAAQNVVVNNSQVIIPPQGMQVGLCIEWEFTATKGAVGTTAGTLLRLLLGATGTTSDTAIAQGSSTTPTAVADSAIVRVTMKVVAVSPAFAPTNATLEVSFDIVSKSATTGIATVGNTGSTVTTSSIAVAAGQIFSINFNARTAETWTLGGCGGAQILKAASP